MMTVGACRRQIKDFSCFYVDTQTATAAEASPSCVTTRTAQDVRHGRREQGGMTTQTSVTEEVAALHFLFLQTLKSIFSPWGAPSLSKPFPIKHTLT